MNTEELLIIKTEALSTSTDLAGDAVRDISGALNALLADMFALYLKTKNFHWHISGPHFRDFHLLLDEQADQIFATTDPIAERVRKIGGTTLRSIGQIARQQRLLDNDADYVTPLDMLAELRDDNKQLTAEMRAHARALRRAQRRGDGQPARGLDRRVRAAHLVPVRSDFAGPSPERMEIDRRSFLGAAATTIAAVPVVPARASATPSSPVKQVKAGLLNVGYAEAGPTGGALVILLHGWPYDIHSFVDVAPILAARGLPRDHSLSARLWLDPLSVQRHDAQRPAGRARRRHRSR